MIGDDIIGAGQILRNITGAGTITDNILGAGFMNRILAGGGTMTDSLIGAGLITRDVLGAGAITDAIVGGGNLTYGTTGGVVAIASPTSLTITTPLMLSIMLLPSGTLLLLDWLMVVYRTSDSYS